MIYWSFGAEEKSMDALSRSLRSAQIFHDSKNPDFTGNEPEIYFSATAVETENEQGNPTIVRRYAALLTWSDEQYDKEEDQ